MPTTSPPSSQEFLRGTNNPSGNYHPTGPYSPEQIANLKIPTAQIAQHAFNAGFRGDSLQVAVAVALAESGGRTNAVGVNGDGSRDRGLWQINTVHKQYSDSFCFNPATCAQAAYAISSGGSKWTPWSVFKNGRYKQFLAEAAQAIGSSGNLAINSGGAVATPSPGAPVGTSYRTHNADASKQVTLAPTADEIKKPSDIYVRGTALGQLLGQFTASVTVGATSEQIPIIQMTFVDPQAQILNAPWLEQATPVKWGSWSLEIAGVDNLIESGINHTMITLWPHGFIDLHNRSGQTRSDVTPGEWIARECAIDGVGVLNYEGQAPVGSIGPTAGTDGKTESVWDTMNRLMSENGTVRYIDFEGNMAYGKPTQIVFGRERFDIGYKGSIDGDNRFDVWEIPIGHLAIDKTNALSTDRELRFKLPRWRAERIRVGMRCVSQFGPVGQGFSKYNGDRIVSEVRWTVDANGDSPVEITAVLPTDPVKPASTDETDTSGGLGTSQGNMPLGTKTANDFVNFALSMTDKPYVYGAAIPAGPQDPPSFDCSSLVKWALKKVGIEYPRVSGDQYKKSTKITVEQALKTRGALLFMGPGGSQHVAISLGNGRSTIEARGKAYGVMVVESNANRGFTLAGLVPELQSGAAATPTSTFGGTTDPGGGSPSTGINSNSGFTPRPTPNTVGPYVDRPSNPSTYKGGGASW